MSPEPSDRDGKLVVAGVAVAPGLAVGQALFHQNDDVDVPVLAITAGDVKKEQRRVTTAIRIVREQLLQVAQSIEKEVGRANARIFSVQSLLLDDPSFRRGIRHRIEEKLVNAEVAVRDEVEHWVDRFASVRGEGEQDAVQDLRDVGRQLLRGLVGRARPARKPGNGPGKQRQILVTEELLPSDVAHLDHGSLAALVTASGGVASHVAILARGLGIPAVSGIDVSALPVRGGVWIVDGNQGQVIVAPTPEDIAQAERRSADYQRFREELLAGTRGYARTADDVAIELMLNVENFEELPREVIQDLRGIGLYRTEFLFMNRPHFPSEEEQFEHYRRALEKVGDREITFRSIDVGGDKPLSYLSVPHEPNPVLGWRGLRLSLEWPDMFYTQLRALLRASAHGRIRILFPMVTMVEEFTRARSIVEEIQSDLKSRDVPFDADIALGAMIEVPAAALTTRALAAEADFLSIGTNDLSQYALAVDRNNARVAKLYQPLHPGLLRLIRHVVGDAGMANTPVCVCGEMAGDPEAALLLLGMGVRSLSVSPYHVPLVKKLIASIRLVQARRILKKALQLDSTTQLRAYVRQETLALAPDLAAVLAPRP